MKNLGDLVTSVAGVCGGRPCIVGTRVPVARVAAWYHQGLSAEDIVREHPHLGQAEVHAALAYYFANREVIDTDLAAESEAFERLRRELAPDPAA